MGLSAEAAAAAAAAAAPVADAAAAKAAAAAPVQAGVEGRGQQSKHMMQVEARLQVSMDNEDRRVKELTEGVLYELLPAALNVMLPNSEDPLTELNPERCRVSALGVRASDCAASRHMLAAGMG